MDLYYTEIKALSPHTGELKTYIGPKIQAISFEDAQNYCENNGLGYCKVIGICVAEIPCKNGTYEPDWSKKIDFEQIKLN
jgi:hypothetical protein